MRRWFLTSCALSAVIWALEVAALNLWPLRMLSNLADLFILPFSIAASLFIPPVGHHHSATYEVARAVLAGFGYVTVFTLTGQGGRFLGTMLNRPPEAGRRSVLTLGFLAATLGMAFYSVLLEPAWLKLRRYEVKIPNLPPELDGFKLAHLSDTHYGPYIGLGHIRRAIGLLNAEKPDLYLLTGDYVHHTPEAIPDGIGVLVECAARLGALAVLGNHDHWEGADACRSEFARHKLRLLDNDRVFLSASGLSDEFSPGSLAVCGVGDLWEDAVDPARALRDVPEDCPRLLLSHNPDVAEDLGPSCRFDLQLSGHTHGGQVSFPGIGATVVPSKYGPKYAGGLVMGPRWPVVVSRGVGMAMLPVRFRVPPEVGLIVLRRQ